MAQQKLALICVALSAIIFVGQTLAVDLIELTDANQAILNLDLSKSLGGVQSAYQNGFKFETVKEAKKFLDQCEYVAAIMSESDDAAFEGMAKQIKSIMAEPAIKIACSLESAQLDEFLELDNLSKDDTIHAPLSNGVYNLLVAANEKVKADPNMSAILAHLVSKRTHEITEELLVGAPNDIEILNGEEHEKKGFFDFETKYMRFCEISLIKPICKLVRSTNLDVDAIAADVEKFAQLVKSNDAAQLGEHTNKSGVTMDELKENCQKLNRTLRPIEQINKYLSAGLLNEEQFTAHRQTDANLDSYVALYDLCSVAQ